MNGRKILFFINAVILLLLFSCLNLSAEPRPGDVYREYIKHWKSEGDFLRVGGKYDYGGKNISISEQIDLSLAIKAEVEIQKCLCHGQTSGLSISINNNPWRLFPESPHIPAPQEKYQHQFNPVIDIPLDELNSGNNRFKLKIDEESTEWPQNLVYGVIFRIYYKNEKPHPVGQITNPSSGDIVGRIFTISLSTNDEVKQVDFFGNYRGFDWDGDGNFHDWQGHIFQDTLIHHIGTDNKPPYRVEFDTSWVPDQSVPMKLSARLVGKNGIIYMVPEVEDISLIRPGFAVRMVEPYDVSQQWVSRLWKKKESLDIIGDLSKAVSARLMWVSWSGGYANGIFINDKQVLDKPTERLYRSDWNEIDIPVEYFRQGTNTIMTGQTEGDKHGMEVQWPGIVLMIQYTEYVPFNGPINNSELSRKSEESSAPSESDLPKMKTVIDYSFDYNLPFETNGGGWEIKKGRFHLSKTENKMPLGNIAVFEKSVTNDFFIKTTCKVADFSNWDDFAVIFGYQDIDNYYFVSFNEQNDPNTNGIFLHRNGKTTELCDFDDPTEADKDNLVEIFYIDGTLWVKRNNDLLGSVSDISNNNGKVGYGSRNNISEYDDLVVKEKYGN